MQVNHPYLGGRLSSQKLDKRFFQNFLEDFLNKTPTIVKFYSCYVIKLYYKGGEWKSYRTNGHVFEKFRDEHVDETYFELNKDINLVTKYWGIPQSGFCDTTVIKK